ncbi:uncharacterized protein DUF3540 [Variovorax sp. 54]|uniref:DUF3540 domain-containing protein n=1 Tax=Variovorax sp. 54 TaxID=2035212 RepID=UPI000C17ED51|nr:DUF3540 domain-containing protein [Variovorax sp. 54]PIF76409.1 uncharacterized protein DUF3540 [Variovorax sp. 54]
MTHSSNSTATVPRKRTVDLGGVPAGPMLAQHCVGLVVASDDGGFTIASGSQRVRGRRAVSCLLEPCMGDTVAGLLVAPDELWVVAVLQREDDVENVLRCQGPTRLEVEGGALTLAAEHFALRAQTARVAVDDTQWVGQKLHFIGSTIKLVGSVFSTVFERVAHFSKSHVRTTEGIDRVQATHLECEAEQLARISGQHLLLNGQDLVKARGGQIHFG